MRATLGSGVGLLALVLGVSILGCGGQEDEPEVAAECSVVLQNTFVRDTMTDWYYWYHELPVVEPKDYTSPMAYLEAVRYRPLDSRYSFIMSKASSEAFYSESQFIGIGVSFQQAGSRDLRAAQVFPDSPAFEIGLSRGDFILSIGGQSVDTLLATGRLSEALGPDQEGIVLDLTWRTLDGEGRQGRAIKRKVTIPTVSNTSLIRLGSRRVGYVFFRNFVTPSVEALDRAFEELQAQGANELVLDLRYNGGGLVSVAQQLGGLIGGERTAGEVFVQFQHNDKKTAYDKSYTLEDRPQALDLDRLVVITTRGSASASELVINGLRPFVDVRVVGDRTYGKPVGQYGFDFCDQVLYPVAFLGRNARGESEFFEGIPADCAAGDDLDHELGDPAEASLAEALHVIGFDRCSDGATSTASVLAKRRSETADALPRDGWRDLVNAW